MIRNLIDESLLKADPLEYCYEKLMEFYCNERDPQKIKIMVNDSSGDEFHRYTTMMELRDRNGVNWYEMRKLFASFVQVASGVEMYREEDGWLFANSMPSAELARSVKKEYEQYVKFLEGGLSKEARKSLYWVIRNEVNNKSVTLHGSYNRSKQFSSNEFVRLGLVDPENNILTRMTLLAIDKFKFSGFENGNETLIPLIARSFSLNSLNKSKLCNKLIDLYGDINQQENLLLRELLTNGSVECLELAKWLVPQLKSMDVRPGSEEFDCSKTMKAHEFSKQLNLPLGSGWFVDLLKETDEKIVLKKMVKTEHLNENKKSL